LKVSAHTTLLSLMLVCLSAMLPLAVFFIRATRIIWTLPAGELPSIGKMLLISIAATGLFCPLSGALFGICWAIHRKKRENQPLGIYLGEALGSAAGGLIFYFVFLPYGSVFTTIWITSGMILCISWWLLRPWPPRSKVRFGHLMWIAVSLLVVSGAVSGSRLDHMSRRWQWGPNLSAVYDTAYHNIALLKKEEQVSVFANGLWLFSEPDRLSAEHGVHLALLQHPNPKTILLLGGGIAGLLEELFKQPGIRYIDYVEPDPDFIRLLKPHLSSATDASLQHPRVRLFHEDPRIFMRRSHARYDVILMNMGDPIDEPILYKGILRPCETAAFVRRDFFLCGFRWRKYAGSNPGPLFGFHQENPSSDLPQNTNLSRRPNPVFCHRYIRCAPVGLRGPGESDI
jgi:spermidine synthase